MIVEFAYGTVHYNCDCEECDTKYNQAVSAMVCERCKHVGGEHDLTEGSEENCQHEGCDCKSLLLDWGDSYIGPTPLLG